jgi:hypothetical protein
MELAWVFGDQQRDEGALIHIDQALEIDPGDAWALESKISFLHSASISPSFPVTLPVASRPLFVWWIRAWRWIGGAGTPLIHRQAFIHRNKRRISPLGRRTGVLADCDVPGGRRGDHALTVGFGSQPAGRPDRDTAGMVPSSRPDGTSTRARAGSAGRVMID